MGRFDWLETGKKKEPEWRPASPGEKPKESFDADHYLQEAERYYREGAYEKALKQYSKALGENPAMESAWLGQVNCLIDLDELKEARTWANKAIEQFPQSGELFAAKATILARMFEQRDAMTLSDKAITKKNPSKYVWLGRGFILLFQKDSLSSAFHCFDKALEGNPLDWFVNLRIGMCLNRHKRYSDAKLYLDKALSLASRNPLVWYELGLCYEGIDSYERAKDAFEQALQYNPEFKGTVYNALGRIQKTGFLTKMWRLAKSLVGL